MHRLCSKGIALTLGLALALLLTESLLRLVGAEPREYVSQDTLARYDFSPGNTVRYSGWIPYNVKEFEVPVHMNSTGWRDREYPLTTPPGTYRILVLGDSYVEAKEVPLEKTFHKRLESGLNDAAGENDRRFEVIALGKGGSGTSDQYEILRRVGLAYEPDLVVLAFFPGNDVSDNSDELSNRHRRWVQKIYGPRVVAAKIAFLDRMIWFDGSYLNHFVADRLLDLYVAHLHLFQDLRREHLLAPNLDVYRTEAYDDDWRAAWSASKRHIRAVRSLAERSGARFLLLVIHSVQSIGQSADALASQNLRGLDLDRPARILTDFARNESMEVLDLGPVLRDFQRRTGKRFYWKHDAHWNDEGHAVVARALFETLWPSVSGIFYAPAEDDSRGRSR